MYASMGNSIVQLAIRSAFLGTRSVMVYMIVRTALMKETALAQDHVEVINFLVIMGTAHMATTGVMDMTIVEIIRMNLIVSVL